MDPDNLTRLIAAGSFGVAFAALGWSIASWRLAGPYLRFHCLWYDNALVIRVFNAGRTADTVEQIELGSVHRTPLTEMLQLPLRVEPGQSEKWVIGSDHLEPDRIEALAGGWSSLWTLSGSMKQRRAEVVPTGQSDPPTSGWRLVPKREKVARFLPLLALGWAFVATEPAFGLSQAASAFALAALALWAWARYTWLSAPKFSRAAWQRRLTLLALLLAVVGGAVVQEHAIATGETSTPLWIQGSRVVLLGLGLLVARAKYGDGWIAWRRWLDNRFEGSALTRLARTARRRALGVLRSASRASGDTRAARPDAGPGAAPAEIQQHDSTPNPASGATTRPPPLTVD